MSLKGGHRQVTIRYHLIATPVFHPVPVGSLPADGSPLLLILEHHPESPGPDLLWLSDEEKQRAHRLKPGPRKQLWIETHAALHHQLALLTKAQPQPNPQPLAFRPNGKPVPESASGIHFNLADTDGCAVLAFHSATVGVDVERVSRSFDFRPVVTRYFSPADVDWLEMKQSRDFFLLWTRKEAVLKYTGAGLTDRLGEFDVSGNDWKGDGSVMFPADELLTDIWVYSFFRDDVVFSVALCQPVEAWRELLVNIRS